MVFSSHLFVYYFLPLALALYYILPHQRGRHAALALLSYAFYGWANPLFLVILWTSTVIDYCCGLAIAGRHVDGTPRQLSTDTARTRRQRAALTASIVTNLSLLGFFKYFDFGVDSWNAMARAMGADGMLIETALHVVLPLGISFYTFQSMSYTIDVYRGHARALASPIDFALYVAMFPQLVAGPIIRFSEVASQFHSRTHTLEKLARGAALFSFGMAKKVLLANPMGALADTTFTAGSLGMVDAWYGLVAYAFQIYFDFSGYSDMAIGLGLMLGFVFPKNFDSPYRACSITEFWRRWHISLSSWLRDYLYLPLGGNRRGAVRTYVNLMAVMLLGGLWHGAAWNFVAWGALHGALLAVERAFAGRRMLPRPLAAAATFIAVNLGWVLFRSDSLRHAGDYASALVGGGPVQPAARLLAGLLYQPYSVVSFVVAGVVVWLAPTAWDYTRQLTAGRATLAVAVFWLALAALATQDYNPFIYFIF